MKKIALLSIVLIASCTPYSHRINMQEDQDRAKVISDKFYGYLKSGDFESASQLCGADAAPKDAKALLVQLNGDLGTLKNVNYESGNSDVTDSHHHTNGEIDLKYTATYDNAVRAEDFVFKFVNDSLKIAGYHSKGK